jgi:molybdopterin-biosynthesis enzyme MoeA-like protein
MKAMFDRYADHFSTGEPIASWRRRYQTRESTITPVLAEATARWPTVSVGSYPSFYETGPQVEVVLKSAEKQTLEQAVAWLEHELDALT